jgi:hypothetical protein
VRSYARGEKAMSSQVTTRSTSDLYVPFSAILKAAVENLYQRLARGASGYRTSARNCWVTNDMDSPCFCGIDVPD